MTVKNVFTDIVVSAAADPRNPWAQSQGSGWPQGCEQFLMPCHRMAVRHTTANVGQIQGLATYWQPICPGEVSECKPFHKGDVERV